MTEIVEIKIETSVEGIRLIILPDNKWVEFENLALINNQTKQVLALGGTFENFADEFQKRWEKMKSKVVSVPIFNVDTFVPEIAGNVVYSFWFNNRASIKKIFRPREYLTINIDFTGYESLEMGKQQEFEFILFKHTFAKKLFINGVEKIWSLSKIKIAHNTLIFSFMSSVILSIIFSVLPIIKIIQLLGIGYPLSLMEGILITTLFVFLICLFAYAGSIFGLILWALFLRPFISREILINSLFYYYPGQKANFDLVTIFLINQFFRTK